MFQELQTINCRPKPFEHYTAADLWTDEYTSSRMLSYHLDGSIDVSSRNTKFIDRSAGWIVSRFGLDESKAVADFGCGPGLYTSRLAESGAGVTGIDFSLRSIRYAREQSQRQNLKIDYVHANYLDYESNKQFDLIIMIMCDFCALGPGQRRALLDKFLALLKPGGAVLFDVYSLRAFEDRKEKTEFAPRLLDGFWSSEPYFGFLCTFKYEPEKVVLDKYTIFEENRTRRIFNWLQYYNQENLTNEIEGRGFVAEEFIGNVAGAAFDPGSREFAVIAGMPTA